MTKRVVRDLPATQSAAVWFEEAFPGGLRAYKKRNPLYDVDIKAAEAMARKRPASRTAEIERKVKRVMAKSKVGATAKKTAKPVKKRKPSAKAIDAAISAAGRKLTGAQAMVHAARIAATPSEVVAKTSPGFDSPIKFDGKGTEHRTLYALVSDLLTRVPLDHLFLEIARAHEAHGHKFTVVPYLDGETAFDKMRADARRIRSVIPDLSFYGITRHSIPVGAQARGEVSK